MILNSMVQRLWNDSTNTSLNEIIADYFRLISPLNNMADPSGAWDYLQFFFNFIFKVTAAFREYLRTISLAMIPSSKHLTYSIRK